MDPEKRIARLEKRLERERIARSEAEAIADRGMRELWLTNRELDKRVEERTATVQETLKKLEAADNARVRFLSTLSHEIRTPLNGTMGMLELLAAHVRGDQGHSYLDSARESAERLHLLLTRLMDLVEITTGDLTLYPAAVRIDALVGEIRSRWELAALKSGHLLSITSFFDDDVLWIDSFRVMQIVHEVLDNAVTHASPGGIALRLLPQDDCLVVEVEDHGPGIAPEQIEAAFEDFGMIDTTAARAHEGLGLGLGISRRIAETMGGSLEMFSDGETSSTVRLIIPSRIGHPDPNSLDKHKQTASS